MFEELSASAVVSVQSSCTVVHQRHSAWKIGAYILDLPLLLFLETQTSDVSPSETMKTGAGLFDVGGCRVECHSGFKFLVEPPLSHFVVVVRGKAYIVSRSDAEREREIERGKTGLD